MGIEWLLIVIVLAALLLWLVPMDAIFKKIIYAIVVICFFVWLLGVFGVNIGAHLNLNK